MVMALNPLHQVAKIKRVVVSTYQAVSGAGANAMVLFSLAVVAGRRASLVTRSTEPAMPAHERV